MRPPPLVRARALMRGSARSMQRFFRPWDFFDPEIFSTLRFFRPCDYVDLAIKTVFYSVFKLCEENILEYSRTWLFNDFRDFTIFITCRIFMIWKISTSSILSWWPLISAFQTLIIIVEDFVMSSFIIITIWNFSHFYDSDFCVRNVPAAIGIISSHFYNYYS